MSVFKMPSKYRRYNFQPRYYDERKEALKNKIHLQQLQPLKANLKTIEQEVNL